MSLLEPSAECGRSNMGLSHGMQLESLNPKLSNRWLFNIPGISADTGTINALPPRKSSRPGIQLTEQPFPHISETIYYPLKAEWKPFNLILYDVKCNNNVVFDWLKRIYDPSDKNLVFQKSCDITAAGGKFKVSKATLELYDGCGNVLETWIFENVYPSNIDWGELNMDESILLVVDLTIRYDRAYFVKN